MSPWDANKVTIYPRYNLPLMKGIQVFIIMNHLLILPKPAFVLSVFIVDFMTLLGRSELITAWHRPQ